MNMKQNIAFGRINISISYLLTSIFCFLPSSSFAYNFAGGTGEPNDPYQIATAEELISIGSDPNLLDKSFILINDIDLGPNLPGGRVFDRAVISPKINNPRDSGFPFTGHFNGNGHVLINLVINEGAGLFGWTEEGAFIYNLRLKSCKVTGDLSTGSLVGFNKGRIENCLVENTTVSAWYSPLGGLVGINAGQISQCRFQGQVSGGLSVGGIAGQNNGEISQCSSIVRVSGNASIGGLIGLNEDGILTQCFCFGEILYDPVLNFVGNGIGGLVGYHQGVLNQCYSVVRVMGDDYVGALVGSSPDSSIITASFENIETSGTAETHPGTGLATEQMQNIDTYLEAGWDFVDETENGSNDVWRMPEGGGYPVLAWEPDVMDIKYVPDLKGLSLEEATVVLNGFGVSLGQIEDMYDPYVSEGFVVSSDLHGFVAKDQAVNILLSKGPYDWSTNVGDGSTTNPYQISTAEQLISIGSDPNLLDKSFVLINDIDLDPNLPGGRVFDRAVIAPDVEVKTWYGFQSPVFSGSFDGNDKTIHNLVIISSAYEFVGFVSVVGQPDTEANIIRGMVKNLHLKNARVVGNDYVGGIAGLNGGRIVSCSVDGDVYGNYSVGGLVGANSNVTIIHQFADGFSWTGYDGGVITSSYATANVTGDRCVGGLAGTNQYYSKALTSHSTGNVTGDVRVGGLIGSNELTCSTSQCYSISSVSGTRIIGGLVGNNYFGLIDTSYAMGNVSGIKTVGGLTGLNLGSISQCYSTGNVGGDEEIGGLVGDNFRNIGRDPRNPHPVTGETILSFWNIDSSGLDTSAGGLGKNTFRMKDIITFLNAGWDFDTIWSICAGQDYPRLQWEQRSCSED